MKRVHKIRCEVCNKFITEEDMRDDRRAQTVADRYEEIRKALEMGPNVCACCPGCSVGC